MERRVEARRVRNRVSGYDCEERGTETDEYGITLMPLGYKVYTKILTKRKEDIVEELGGVPHNITGFRKRGFVDFKAAFLSMNSIL